MKSLVFKKQSGLNGFYFVIIIIFVYIMDIVFLSNSWHNIMFHRLYRLYYYDSDKNKLPYFKFHIRRTKKKNDLHNVWRRIYDCTAVIYRNKTFVLRSEKVACVIPPSNKFTEMYRLVVKCIGKFLSKY